MNTLVICRIADQRLRKSLYARLKNRGFAKAKGVFECDFDAREMAALRRWLNGIDYGADDCVILYSLCAVCQKERLTFGNCGHEPALDGSWVII